MQGHPAIRDRGPRHALPPEVSGSIEQMVVTRDDEVWSVAADATGPKKAPRTGSAEAVALDLGSGQRLSAKKAR